MTTHFLPAAIAVAGILSPVVSQAQDTTYVRLDTRIKAGGVHFSSTVTGQLVDLERNRVTVRTEEGTDLTVEGEDLRLQVFESRGTAVRRSFLVGLGIGLIADLLVGASEGDTFGIPIAFGGVVGAATGLIPRDRWRRVERPWAALDAR